MKKTNKHMSQKKLETVKKKNRKNLIKLWISDECVIDKDYYSTNILSSNFAAPMVVNH